MKTASAIRDKQIKARKNPLFIVILILLIASLIGYAVFFSSANIAINLSSRSLSQTTDILANINNASISVKNNTIPAEILDVNESSSSSLSTTGTKDVGNIASGTITIYNQGSTAIIVPKGTSFNTNDQNAYKFSLANDVSIPAGQSQTGQLQAPSAGAQYNIPSGTLFVVGIPNVTATATSSFTGGSSSNAQTVAQADQDNLKKSLTDQLYSKGKDDLANKVGSDLYAIKSSIKEEEVTKSFDSNVGDKASIVNLSLTIKVSEIVYKKSDIEKLENGSLATLLKSDENLTSPSTQFSFTSYNAKSGDIKIHVVATGSAVPVVKENDLRVSLAGKSKDEAMKQIQSINGVKSVSIDIKPWWVSIFGHIPTRKSNIQFSISTK